jgi:predicted metal-dependent enzyme (double-stranded beta helix superfamily)
MPSAGSTPPPSLLPDPVSWIKAQVPPGRDLGRAELRQLAETVGRATAVWQQLVRHDPDRRHYVQLHRDPHVDVWLICWTNEQDTGFHDHDVSSGAVYVCSGELAEDRFELSDGTLRRATIVHPQRTVFDFDASHVHCVGHAGGEEQAVSIHVYSPALWRMGYYEVGESGLLQRVSVTYAEEIAAA